MKKKEMFIQNFIKQNDTITNIYTYLTTTPTTQENRLMYLSEAIEVNFSEWTKKEEKKEEYNAVYQDNMFDLFISDVISQLARN